MKSTTGTSSPSVQGSQGKRSSALPGRTGVAVCAGLVVSCWIGGIDATVATKFPSRHRPDYRNDNHLSPPSMNLSALAVRAFQIVEGQEVIRDIATPLPKGIRLPHKCYVDCGMLDDLMNLGGNRKTGRRFKCPLKSRRHERLAPGKASSGSLWKNREPLPLIYCS